MDLNIDFNNQHILRGYLVQALPQVELEGARITVGKEGGLAYCLFGGSADIGTVPRELRMNSRDQIESLRTYFDALDEYIGNARAHARKFDFDMVSVSDGIISPIIGSDLYFSGAGIGDVTIGSVAKFERFLEMIKEGRGNLELEFGRVKGTIEALKKQQSR